MQFDSNKKVVLEIDFFDFVSKKSCYNTVTTACFDRRRIFQKKHALAECNYEIYDRKLIIIVCCFKAWKPKFENLVLFIQMLNNYKNLKHL